MENIVLLAFLLVYYPGLVFVQLIFYTKFLFCFFLEDDFFLVRRFSLGNGQTLTVVKSNGGLLQLKHVNIL